MDREAPKKATHVVAVKGPPLLCNKKCKYIYIIFIVFLVVYNEQWNEENHLYRGKVELDIICFWLISLVQDRYVILREEDC